MKVILESNWRYKTIENLEKKGFGDSNNAPTKLIKRCLELCKVPLDQFTVEDLRLMIGQDFSLRYLVPLAIEHLKGDIFIEGDFFPGDLLENVLSIKKKFWLENKDLWKEANDLIKNRRHELDQHKISTSSFDMAFDYMEE